MRPTINVIDMYHGNVVRTADFAMLRQNGVFGIIHKASQGSHYKDPKFQDRRKAATDAGMLFGAYHFLDSTNADDQAGHFLEQVNTNNSDPILLACDYENSDHQPALHQCMAFMAAIDRASAPGVSCVLYSGNVIRENLRVAAAGGHQNLTMAGAMQFFQAHRLWLAEYGPHLNIPWPWNAPVTKSSDQSQDIPAPGVFLWQFTEKGRVNPLVGNTDGNFFNGTFEELQARWLA